MDAELTQEEIERESRKYNEIRFKDLSPSLKAIVVIGWITFSFYIFSFLIGVAITMGGFS